MPECRTYFPPSPASILILGETPGADEEREGRPFIGQSGKLLDQMLIRAGIVRQDCAITNVFSVRPENNDITKFCVDKKTAIKLGGSPSQLPVQKGKYLHPDYAPHINRLERDISVAKPTLIIACGNVATWATLGLSGISSIRGVVAWSDKFQCKVLPIYHPAAVLRQHALFSTTVIDLCKARAESEFPEIRSPVWSVLYEPSLADLFQFLPEALASEKMTIDIETARGQITCIGFGLPSRKSLVIPLVDRRKPGYNYWATIPEERQAWRIIRKLCESKAKKILQNGLYDIQYLWKFKVPVRNFCCDTMILHHSMQPELPKGLGYLGSLYTSYPSWKNMKPKNFDTGKANE